MSEKIEGFSIGLDLDAVGVNSGLKDLKGNLKTVSSEMRANMSAFDRGDKSVGKYQKQLEGLNKKLEVQKTVTEKARLDYEKMVAVHGKGSEEAEKAAREYNHQAAELNNLNRYVENATDELNKMEKAQADAASAWGKFGAKMTETGEKLKAVGGKMKDVGKGMSTYVSAPILAAGGAVAKFAIDQEKSFAKVSTLLTGSGADYEKYKGKIREYSSEMGVSFEDYSEAVYGSISAGIDQGEAIEFTGKAVKLAKGGFTDTAKAVDVMTTAINAYGLESGDAEQLSDKLITTQNLGKTTVDELASSMGSVIPVAKAQNVSFDQLSAGYATLTKNGVATSEAGTYMKAMFGEMGKAGSKADKVIRELSGKGFAELQAEGKDVGDVLNMMQGEADKNGQSLSDMFGSVQAGSAALVLSSGDSAEYKEMLDAMGDSAGATDEAFNKMQNTTGEKMAKAMNKMKNAGAELGDILLPYLAAGADKLSALVEKFSGLSPAVKKSIVVIGGVVAAIGPLLVVAGTLISSVGSIMAVVGGASAALGAGGLAGGLATAGGALLTFATGPIGIAIAAVAGIGIATGALVKHLKKDALPEVDRFGKGVSGATKEALGGFFKLSDGASQQMADLSINGTKITAEMATGLADKYRAMNKEILTSMKDRHAKEIGDTKKLFSESSALSSEREGEILKQMETSNRKKEADQVQYEKRVAAILHTASKEKRELTKGEQDEINGIQKKMNETAVVYLTDNERDQKVILENMKNQAGALSAQQAAAVTKNSAKARDEVIKDSDKTYNDTVALAIQQRDETGTISAKEADAIIREAKKKRDESVKHAENTHKDVVKEAKNQAGEHVKEVDWETGEILSKWDVMKNGTVKFAKDMGTGIKGWFKDQWDDTKKKNKEGQKKQSEDWQNLKDDTVTKAKELGTGVKDWATDQWKETKKKNKEGRKKQSEDWQNLKDDTIRKAKDMGTDVKKWGSDQWDNLKQNAKDSKKKLGEDWQNLKDDSVKKAKDMGTDVKKWGSDQWTDVKTKTAAGVLKVKNGWEDMKTQVKNKAEDLRKGATDKIESMRSGIVTKTTDMRDKATGLWTGMKTSVIKVATDMKDKVKEKFDNIVTGAKQLPGRMKDGIVSMANQAVDGVKKVGQRMADAFGRVVNGIINGINTITGKIGVTADIPNWTVPTFAKGTDGTKTAGPIIVGDKHGREIVELPNGRSFLSPDTDTMLHAPKGTRVIPNKITEQYLKGDIPHYAKGVGVGGWLKDKAKGFASAVSNVWDFMKNPRKLLDLMPLPKLEGMSGAFGNILKGGLEKVKTSAVDKIKSMFEGAGEDGGPIGKVGKKGPFPSPYRLTSRAGMRIHPIFGTRKFHAGDDWAAPRGTRIPSRGAGKVVHTGFHRALGNYVDVQTGAYKFRYQHNTRNGVKKGQMVKQGQSLGTVGSTGNSTGPHLHFEVTKNGKFVAPKSLGFKTGGLVNTPGNYNLAEEGHPEFVIPTKPSRRTEAMKLLALAGQAVMGNRSDSNKRPGQLASPSGGGGGDVVKLLMEQNELLRALLTKDNSLYLDGNELGAAIAPNVSRTLSARQGMKNAQGGRA